MRNVMLGCYSLHVIKILRENMTYKMTLMALGLGAAMLTGCGSSNDDGDNEIVIPETTAQAEVSIVGAYKKACEYYEMYDESYIGEVTINADKTWVYKETAYPTKDCSGDSIGSEGESGTYEVGALTKGSDGEPAFEFDTTVTDGPARYSMIRFTATRLIDADEDDTFDGRTPETRANNFGSSENEGLIRQ